MQPAGWLVQCSVHGSPVDWLAKGTVCAPAPWQVGAPRAWLEQTYELPDERHANGASQDRSASRQSPSWPPPSPQAATQRTRAQAARALQRTVVLGVRHGEEHVAQRLGRRGQLARL